ncbi:MAG TPA: tyrosine-type recombinase/integrase [Candidatus Kapabacteria bacterium]|nr:tyrosine-type recombinase/integrase [Candidatus Kapabacteria bacterium]
MAKSGQQLRLTHKELVDHCESFIVGLAGKAPETRGTYQRSLRKFLNWFPVDSRFHFQRRDVERYRRFLVEKEHLKEASVGTYLTALRRFCQYLIDIGVLAENPASEVIGGRRPERHSRSHLTYEEVELLLDAIDASTLVGARDLALIQLMLGCALSERECRLADVGDIIRRGRPAIRVQGKGRTVKDETVPMPPIVLASIDEYLERRFAGASGVIDPEAPLFVSLSNHGLGERMQARGMREAINRRLVDSGVKRDRTRTLTAFSLRHTAGLMMVDSGASLEELMSRMRIAWRPTAQLYFRLRNRPWGPGGEQ